MNPLAVIIVLGFVFFIGILVGKTNREGRVMNYTNELPDFIFKVIWLDEQDMIIETVSPRPKRFFIKREVIQVEIEVGDKIRKLSSNSEYKELNLKVVGYPPLVKC